MDRAASGRVISLAYDGLPLLLTAGAVVFLMIPTGKHGSFLARGVGFAVHSSSAVFAQKLFFSSFTTTLNGFIRQQDEMSSDGTIRWMNVTRYLKNRNDKQSRQIIFAGHKLDMNEVWNVRDEFFPPKQTRK